MMTKLNILNKTYYDLTPLQQIIYLQQKFSLKKAVSNIPIALTFEPQLDFELLKKAIRIEIERNDVMRLFFCHSKDGIFQYFRNSFMPEDFKYYDFTGKTPEQQRQGLIKESEKAISIDKDIAPYEFIFFTAYDGRNGFYFKQHHLANDADGIIIMLNDLMKIYVALQNNSEMPPALGSFEALLQKNLNKMNNEVLESRDVEFFKQYHRQFEMPPIFTSAYSSRTLDEYRKKKKDPSLRSCPAFSITSSKSVQSLFRYGENRTRQIENFCRMHRISIMTLFYFLIRTQSSKANNNETDVTYNLNNANRATLLDKKTSGMVLNTYVARTVITPDISIQDALNRIDSTFIRFYRHHNLSGLSHLDIVEEIYPKNPLESWYPGSISYIPFNVELPKDWKYEIDWISAQTIASPLFIGIIHDLRNHNLDLYIEYLTEYATQREVEWIAENFQKMIDMILADPNVTIQTVLDNMEEFSQ